MNFSLVLEEPNIEHYSSIRERVAVRSILMLDNKILLVKSNRGDYKFPGGGVEENEDHFEGLKREIREETGYINCAIHKKAGIVIERRMDEFNENVLFQMTSHYYLCELINEEKTTQQLDDYESELDFTPKWVNLADAIQQNEGLTKQIAKNGWLKRETLVLKEIQKGLMNNGTVTSVKVY